jgi:hypothetical protein
MNGAMPFLPKHRLDKKMLDKKNGVMVEDVPARKARAKSAENMVVDYR